MSKIPKISKNKYQRFQKNQSSKESPEFTESQIKFPLFCRNNARTNKRNETEKIILTNIEAKKSYYRPKFRTSDIG